MVNSAAADGTFSLERPRPAGGEGTHHRVARASAARAGARSTTSCATGCSRASATGASRSRSSGWTASRRPLPESELPVRLPELEDFKPIGHGREPARQCHRLARDHRSGHRPAGAARDQHHAAVGRLVLVLPALHRPARTPTRSVDPAKEKYWMPVDLYVGGAEHAVLHLLYARFWHKVLYDLGVVSTPEPFQKLVHQGMILGEDNQKMSKRRGNVVNPDDMIDEYGADALRLYEMFMGPLEAMKPWSSKGVEGISRFLDRVWRLFVERGRLAGRDGRRAVEGRRCASLHQTIAQGHRGRRGAQVQHGDLADDGVRERDHEAAGTAARAARTVRAAARAVRAAPRRGAVAATRPRRVARVRAVAVVRPGAVRRGHRHGGRAGERQAARHARAAARRRAGRGAGGRARRRTRPPSSSAAARSARSST